MNEVEESLRDVLIEKSSSILQIPPEDVLWEADIDEFGYDSMEVNRLCTELNQEFEISIQPVLFLEVTSLQVLSSYLLKRFPAQIEQRCV